MVRIVRTLALRALRRLLGFAAGFAAISALKRFASVALLAPAAVPGLRRLALRRRFGAAAAEAFAALRPFRNNPVTGSRAGILRAIGFLSPFNFGFLPGLPDRPGLTSMSSSGLLTERRLLLALLMGNLRENITIASHE